MLPQFLKWMHNGKYADVSYMPYSNVTNMGANARFRVQKGVYLAKHLGLDLPYEYKGFRNGPYSAELDKECDRLVFDDVINAKGRLNFKKGILGGILKRRDDDWLLIATTLIHFSAECHNEEDLVETVESVEYPYPKKYIRDILNDLRDTPLMDAIESNFERVWEITIPP